MVCDLHMNVRVPSGSSYLNGEFLSLEFEGKVQCFREVAHEGIETGQLEQVKQTYNVTQRQLT